MYLSNDLQAAGSGAEIATMGDMGGLQVAGRGAEIASMGGPDDLDVRASGGSAEVVNMPMFPQTAPRPSGSNSSRIGKAAEDLARALNPM